MSNEPKRWLSVPLLWILVALLLAKSCEHDAALLRSINNDIKHLELMDRHLDIHY